jgi:hypothetical protein
MARSKGPQTPPVKSDVYVGLLFISLMAQIAGAVFFYLDWSAYPTSKPTPPSAIALPAPVGGQVGGGGAAPVPVAPPMGGAAMMGGAPPMGGMMP